MCKLITSSFKEFDRPVKVRIADIDYDGIVSQSTKKLLDADGKVKTLHNLTGLRSDISSYEENGKVVRSLECFNRARTLKLGNKIYNNVVSRLSIPMEPDVYTIMDKSGNINNVKVWKDGMTLDTKEMKTAYLKKQIGQGVKIIKNFFALLLM